MRLFRPDRYRKLFETLNRASPVIARGAGLSYCAASFASDANVISSECFNRFLEFDREQGLITVESGVKLGDLVKLASHHSWHVPILPGHPAITVGGCIAFNVHGKSQFKSGNFETIVDALWLFHPDYGELECSRKINSNIFSLTLGGFGMTGFITKARLRLERTQGKGVLVQRVAVSNLFEAVRTMRELSQQCPIIYSWNNLNLDLNAKSSDLGSFGRGFVYAERFDNTEVKDLQDFNDLKSPHGPLDRLGFINNFTASIVCNAYSLLEVFSARERRLGLRRAAFPINGKEIYYRMFGQKGFREYQLIIPEYALEQAFAEIRAIIRSCAVGPALGSLKLFKGEAAYLNFSADGVCISLDLAEGESAKRCFSRLDNLVLNLGATVNIAKDSRIERGFAEKVFPEFDLFRRKLLEYDPARKFQSALSRRLEI